MDAGANETHAKFIFGPVVIFLEIFSVGAHIHKEYGGVQRFVAMLFGNNRLFYGVHAADAGAIAVVTIVGIAGANALDPGDVLGFLFIRWSYHMALIWS